MLSKLKSILIKTHENNEVEDDVLIYKAAGALMLEIARADNDVEVIETDEIISSLREIFQDLNLGEEEFLSDLKELVEESISTYEFTHVINEQCSRDEKIKILEALWRVSYVDGRIDKYEEYFIRKIMDLLHLSHSDFIKAKLKVLK